MREDDEGKPKRRGWTFRTKREFWHRDDLSLEAKGMAHILLSYADRGGIAFPTEPQLMIASGKSHNAVKKYLAELKDKNCLTWGYFRDNQGHNRRRFDLSPIHIKPTDWDGLGGNKRDRQRTMMSGQ